MKTLKNFSLYLKEKFLRELAVENIRIARELNFPLMRLASNYTEEQLIEMGIVNMGKFLDSLVEDTAIQRLNDGLRQWEQDKIQGVAKFDIQPSDIILANAAQQKALLKFLPKYVKDIGETMIIVGEVIDYFMKAQDMAVRVFYQIQNEDKKEIVRKSEALQKSETVLANRTDKLAEMTRELTRSNQELEQFAYVASHDLQEPLRMVTSYLQLLENRYKERLDKDADDFIRFAVDGSIRMRNLINSLLEYSRVNRIKPFRQIDVNQVIHDILLDLKDTIQENDAIVKCEKLDSFFGDEVLIGQLFMNLISNAIKFRGIKRPEITIRSKKEIGNTLFSIKDNGIGIKTEYFDKIFVIFQRLNSSEKYPGTGIGLAICKKIVERHGGKIWVESQVGEGSSFCFTIRNTSDTNVS